MGREGIHAVPAPAEAGRAARLPYALDRLATLSGPALAVSLALLLLLPDSTHLLVPQADVMRVAVAIPALPLLAAALRADLRPRGADAALVLYLAVAVGTWRLELDHENPRLLVALLLPFLFYAWGRIAGGRRDVAIVVWTIVGAGALGALTVLYEAIVARTPLFVDQASYYWNPTDDLLFRPGGLYGSPPGAALVFSMALFLALYCAVRWRDRRRTIALSCAGVLMAGIVVTFARGSYVGVAVGAVAFLAIGFPRPILRRIGLTALGGLALVALSLPAWIHSDIFEEGLLRSSTFDYRLENWQLVGHAIDHSPERLGLGDGFNALLLSREEYGGIPPEPGIAPASPLVTDGPHNQYLLTLLETGIPGLLALVAWLGLVIAGGVRTARGAADMGRRRLAAALLAAVVAYAAACLFGDHLRYDTGVAIVALLAGMLVSTAELPRSDETPR